MLWHFRLFLLGWLVHISNSQTESPGQAKRCDKEAVLTIRTECQSCGLNLRIKCPDGYTKITNNSVGVRDCRYTYELRAYSLFLPGCRHICRKNYLQPQCCPGHWGPDCEECPGGAESPCNGRGSCDQGMEGNGSCSCQEGFGGTACETCADDNLFGPNCSSVCSCVHGVCNNGPGGNGTCECYSAYTGPSCDTPVPECATLLCPENSRCSPSSKDENQLECRCLPNYKGDGKTCEPINPCLQNICHPHAQCTYLGPNQHSCSCQEGYYGDGQVCLPIDPCQTNFGNCPTQSTVCRYDGPGQSHCECMEHYHNFVPGVGCSMINICESNNPCHRNANCTTVAPGQTECTCQKGYVGDGLLCYGNIMEQLRELNTEPRGKWQGSLTSFISLLDEVYAWPLSSLGPFTVLLPSDRAFKASDVRALLMDKEAAKYFVKLHIIAGQMSTEQMNLTDTFYTLTGKSGEIFSADRDGQFRLKLYGSKKMVQIIQGNIIASNGLIHILDQAMDHMEPTFESNTEKSIMMMLQPRYSKFRSLLEETNMGHTLDEDGVGGPYTIFVPSNEALDSMKDGTLDYLLSPQGSRKLLELIRYHIIPFTQLDVASIVSTPHIRSMANQIIRFNTTNNGQILANEVAIDETEITAKNGRIYTLTGVLIPPSIIPILPHQCNETTQKIRMGTCVNCYLKYRSKCPANSEIASLYTRKCVYRSRSGLKSGCALLCSTTVQIPTCCEGFYGPDCNPCPGGFLNPCSGNGWCEDGLWGKGICICKDGFQGSRCQFCSDPNKYGPRCNQTCPCVHGTCDNRIDSNGACLPNTCREGTAGTFCDRQTSTCGPYVQLCHIHATCIYSNGTASCICKEGYEGDGTFCSSSDPCMGPTQGGCSRNAECIKTKAGTHACVCQQGWTGNGRDCVEINNCLLPGAGGCHVNATCLYVGPGQNECECKKGFRGNGIDCEPIIACLEQTGKCHPLATCQLVSSGVWNCVCQEGYEGDGFVCYGNAAVELSFLSEAAIFNQWINNASLQPMLSTTLNLTVLVPSQQAIEDMDPEEKTFWLSQNNIPALIKYHMLLGTYRVAELQNLSSSGMMETSLQGSFLRMDKADGNITIEGASILDGDNVATNGVIHIINKVLVPRSGLTGSLPNLLTRLDQMPDYSIFRGYVIQYNLASQIEAADAYTVFAPHNNAIESYVKEKKVTTLEEDILRYHVVLEEKLLKNDMHNGMHRETMLGFSYLLGFFLHDDQLYVNEAPVNYTNVATDKGVIHGLGKVLEIQKNRCDINDTTIIRGKCGACLKQSLTCPLGTKPLIGDETRKCIYTIYFMGRRNVFIGCQAKCVKTVITRECCAGFFGPQCQACPGKGQNVCFGNGICLDGVNGTGRCECSPGFSGTACETCAQGKYGIHCDQACPCVHGRCNQGPSGDGSCDCDVGWRGVACDRAITKDDCNGTCHTSANCLLNLDGTASCKCAAGFQGNGTICTAINACEISNGGCSAQAHCKRTIPGSRECVCKAGYTGDGIVCIEINPCLENHGGCDKNAECTQTGPNQAVCNCLPKYTGDGKVCTHINVCLFKNGGCSPFAVCNHTGEDERTCTCKKNYTGDGITCRGSIYQELPKDSKTSQYFFQLQEHAIRELAGPGPFTVFAPSSASFNEEHRLKDWDQQGVIPQILRYHVVACQQLLLENLKSISHVTSLQGEPLIISVSQDTVYINNKAKIISSNIISTNGVIHIIDKFLSPENLIITPRDTSGRILQNLTTMAINHGYHKYIKLIQDSGLLSIITDPIHIPVTLFWPTDQALQALPPKQQEFLFNPINKDKLREYLKFHVIRDSKALATDLLRSDSWKTLQGSELRVTCGTGNDTGELFLNDQMCRIVQRGLQFDVGVAYGIDCLLMDPTLGGRCDTFTSLDVLGDCGSCSNTPKCPKWSKSKGKKQTCRYNLMQPYRNLEGCQNLCALVVQIPMCCRGYYLPDCQACPGGPDIPCNNRGICINQLSASRECKCNEGFNGTSCDLCLPGRFGPHCQPCGCSVHGQCDEGILGSGLCFCEAGWTGHVCDVPTVSPPVCTPPCSAHATCMENNTCECNLNYEGDGLTCTVVDFCKQNNGGCAKVATCSQKNTTVSCSCPTGFRGDGYTCLEIDPCADGINGGCHEHATCNKIGRGKHKCRCKDHYVGDGLNCEPEQLPLDRCLQDNGQCHADANCADLHFQDTTVGVFHLRSPLGQYKLTFDKAKEACANEAAAMATYTQLSYAQKASYHLCSAGWLESGWVAYPTAYASQKCGSGVVGIVDYGPRVNKSEMWDVFCYRMKDVNCTCKEGYVGDGFSCSGNLLQVLMTFPSLTNFLTKVLAYSNSSAQGQAFLKHLTDLSHHSTLFVPQNSGLQENETLSGRDIEHHLANVNISFYDDLVNGTILQTRLGSQLLITTSQDQLQQETRFVDGRTILQWDIFASNGIIHVISKPLKAPPAPATSAHPGLGTGIFFAIILVTAAIVLAAYSYFRLNRRTIGFQHFESEEDINVAALGKQQPENISNPMYESVTSEPPEPSYDPFMDADTQQVEGSDPLGAL
ncbi:stabilin-2 isoform X1 [Perognathus longimembris pacificus]|uniref:stabilin-2 isoform X1 n=1 Tax=Perognathus longimembris pacificus TaxID=214514 RepID=UPI00201961F3|nr:stabilin-2 isoform X1 [Perognathus longimembris pacificus]